ITSWITESDFSSSLLLIIICAIFIVLGFFMDGTSIILLTIPLLYPITLEAGFDPIWLGVILVVLVEIGQITPPLGLNLFVVQGVDPDAKLSEIMTGVFP